MPYDTGRLHKQRVTNEGREPVVMDEYCMCKNVTFRSHIHSLQETDGSLAPSRCSYHHVSGLCYDINTRRGGGRQASYLVGDSSYAIPMGKMDADGR